MSIPIKFNSSFGLELSTGKARGGVVELEYLPISTGGGREEDYVGN